MEEQITTIQEDEDNFVETSYIKMDYSLATAEERIAKAQEIILNTAPEKLTTLYLKKLADYIVFAKTKEEKRRGDSVLTDNRMVTVNRRETSFEGLVGKLENGEDGIYNMIAEDKNIIFQPKDKITDAEIESIPALGELVAAIAQVEKEFSKARGKRAYQLKQQLIQMRQDQYVIKNCYNQYNFLTSSNVKSLTKIELDSGHTYMDEKGEVHSTSIVDIYNPTHISLLLCNYSKLKEDSWDKFNSDCKWLMEDLDNIIDAALQEKYPLFYDILIYKIDGKTNQEIQSLIEEKYNIKHSIEYISSLWRNKIPKLIAEEAANEWLEWHFTQEEKGRWKRCSRCGKVKLAHNHFFSKNTGSKDNFYSICKECRNKKG